MPIAASATHLANALVSVLLAPQCAACKAILDTPLAGCVCVNCWDAVRPITPPVCDGCGDPLPAPAAQLCLRCSTHTRVIDRARAVGEYEGTLRELIHAFKYDRRRSLAAGLAGLMRQRGQALLERADCAVPVPLHRRRERARGFNQARALSQHLGVPVLEALVRARHTLPQVALAADRRHANVRGAFTLRTRWFGKPVVVAGLNVVLVDDVSTTGATLDACAVVLRDAGVREVCALTAARVVTRPR